MKINFSNSKEKYLISFINIVIALLIVIYTINRRFLTWRFPKDLFIIQNNVINLNLVLLIIISIILSTYIIYKNIFILSKKQNVENIFSKTLLKITDFIENALMELYNTIGSLLQNPYDNVSYLAQKFYKYFQDISETFFLFVLYIIRITIVICFLIDIFVYFQLNYMYKSLYLLCVSLIINFLFYILKDFSQNLEDAASYLIIKDEGLNSSNNLPIYRYKLKEEFKHLNLNYHIGQYILCSKLSGYLENYERYKMFFSPRINIIIYSLYLIGWLYVLYLNLILYF